jgi:hypothetical protein
MKIPAPESEPYEFYFPTVDTLAQVEKRDGEIVIRTSRNTFSEDRRTRFIRELAAEGFIPDGYRWLASASPGAALGIRWLVDTSCFEPDRLAVARTRRFMVRLLSSAAMLWLAMIGLLFLHPLR